MFLKSSIVVAPVLLFTYKRLDVLKRTVHALKLNFLAQDTELFIFSDGPKNDYESNQINILRKYLKTIDGFKSIHIYESEINKGLANSIIKGVDKIFKNYDCLIVLEDDLLTTPNFLLFMNQCLEKYKNNKNIFSISGYSPPINPSSNFDVYAFSRNSSHGWGTWKDRWLQVDWNMPDYHDFIKSKVRKFAFNQGGSDLSRMLKKQMEGKINSWSIRFCYYQFKTNTLTVYPTTSKIQNIGFGKEATHTKDFNRFFTKIDSSSKEYFDLPDVIDKDEITSKKFRNFYSFRVRGMSKLKSIFYKMPLFKGSSPS